MLHSTEEGWRRARRERRRPCTDTACICIGVSQIKPGLLRFQTCRALWRMVRRLSRPWRWRKSSSVSGSRQRRRISGLSRRLPQSRRSWSPSNKGEGDTKLWGANQALTPQRTVAWASTTFDQRAGLVATQWPTIHLRLCLGCSFCRSLLRTGAPIPLAVIWSTCGSSRPSGGRAAQCGWRSGIVCLRLAGVEGRRGISGYATSTASTMFEHDRPCSMR